MSGQGRTAAQLPSGDVVFGFTDVVGSTALLRALGGERFQALLHEHRSLVTAAVERENGYLLSSVGDECFFVFAEAASAVRAAVAVQTQLQGHPWPGDGAVTVRLGLHRGTDVPAPHAGDYAHLAVHQAARVSSAAQRGQVLVTQDLFQVALDLGLQCADLGSFWIRDFDGPQRLVAIGDTVTPPMTTEPAARPAAEHGSLPRPRSSFIGREVELRELGKLALDNALVTVTGAGGIGKTRVAVEVAAHWNGMVTFVDVSTLGSPGALAAAAAEAAGAGDVGADAVAALCQQLSGHQALLVLDCCEAQIDEVAALVDAVLAGAPDLTVLCTSREALRVDGELVRRLDPLGLPTDGRVDDLLDSDGVRLFVSRATAAGAGLDLSRDAADVLAVCQRVTGIPLALELAAARVPDLGLHGLLTQLTDLFGVLDRGLRSAPPRQQALESVLAWSHERLRSEEQQALAALSVLVGDVPAPAAAELAGTNDAVVDRLVEVSLVERSEDGRLRLLDPVREYAGRRLDEAAQAEVRGRVLAWCQQVWSGSDDAGRLREQPHLLAVLDWTAGPVADRLGLALGAGPVWERRGLGLVGRDRLIALADEADAAGVDPVGIAQARLLAASLAMTSGATLLAPDLLRRALPVLQQAERSALVAHAAFLLAQVLIAQGDAEGGGEALSLVERHAQSPAERAEAMAGRGRLLAMRGQVPEGLGVVGAAVRLLRESPPSSGLVTSLDLMGMLTGLSGDSVAGGALCAEAAAIADSLGMDVLRDQTLVNVAQNAVRAGNAASVAPLLAELTGRFRERGDMTYLAGCALTLGRIHAQTGRSDEAVESLREAQALFAEQGQVPGEGAATGLLAEALLALGREEEAGRELARAVELAGASGDPLVLAQALTARARECLRRGDSGEARVLADQAAAACADAGAPEPAALAGVRATLATGAG